MSAEHHLHWHEIVILSVFMGSVVYLAGVAGQTLYLFKLGSARFERSRAGRVACLVLGQIAAMALALGTWAVWPFKFDIMLWGPISIPAIVGELIAVPLSIWVLGRFPRRSALLAERV